MGLPNFKHPRPCQKMLRFEFIGAVQCSLGDGHLSPCRAAQSSVDVARLCRLSRYESALQEIARFGGDCGGIAAEALEFD